MNNEGEFNLTIPKGIVLSHFDFPKKNFLVLNLNLNYKLNNYFF